MNVTRFILRLSLAALSFATASFASAQTAVVGSQWVQSSTTGPSARQNANIAYDATTGTAVMFGGGTAETWTWNGTFWTKQSPATSPPLRSSAAMAYDATHGVVVMFGGAGSSSTLSDTWTWNGTTWSQKSPSATPPAREYASMAYDAATGTVVMFGGLNNQGIPINDTWTWNGTTWTQQMSTNNPGIRAQSQMAYDAATSSIVLFSGGNGAADTWTWNGSWTQQSPATSPSARLASVMAYNPITGNVVLFGGYLAGVGTALNDTWAWNGTTWTQLSSTSNPSGRYSSAMDFDSATGAAVLFGGYNGSSNLSDTWSFSADAFTASATNVGSTSSFSATFHIATTGTLGTPRVLTNGTSGLDFTYVSSGSTCDGSTVGDCTVNLSFTPKSPGLRTGAVELVDASGNILATNFISGMATSPLSIIGPGVLSTAAGNGSGCNPPTNGCGDGGAATAAQVFSPIAIALDGAGDLYSADYSDSRVRRVDASTGVITTIAGNGNNCNTSPLITGACGDGGAATAATIYTPDGIAIDGAGNIYISDTQKGRIRRVDGKTGIISTVVGNNQACGSANASAGAACGDGGLATSAAVTMPQGMTTDAAGNLYLVDAYAERVRKITVSTGIITTVAGSGAQCSNASASSGACGDGGQALSASFKAPNSVSLDSAGNLYITDENDQRIRKVTASTGIITTLIGNGNACTTTTATSNPCGDNGLATSAQVSYPTAVAIDPAGNVYIADYGDYRLRVINAVTGYVTTVAGNGKQCSNTTAASGACGDGSTTSNKAATVGTESIAIDGYGNLYIADTNVNRIRKVSTSTGINFPTVTAPGATNADGTLTATISNIGNASLTISSQTVSSANFTLANPMSGGCSTSVAVASSASCTIGVTFTPQLGAPAQAVGDVNTVDNNLNASGTQTVLAIGSTTASAAATISMEVIGIDVAVNSTSAAISFTYGWAGTPPTGAITVKVNGSTTGVGTPACQVKASHANCTALYTGSLLTAPGSFTTSVTIASDTNYSSASGTSYLTIVGADGSSAKPSPEPVSFTTLPFVTPAAAPWVSVGGVGFMSLPTASSAPTPDSTTTASSPGAVPSAPAAPDTATPTPAASVSTPEAATASAPAITTDADDSHPCADGTVVSHMACAAK